MSQYDESRRPAPVQLTPARLPKPETAAKTVLAHAPLAFAAFERGRASSRAEGWACFERVRERIESGALREPHKPADDALLTVFAARCTFSQQGADAALSLLLEHGLAHAVAVAARLADVALRPTRRSQILFDVAGGESPWVKEVLSGLGLRVRLAASEEQRALRDLVLPRWSTQPLSYARLLALAFEDGEWMSDTLPRAIDFGDPGFSPGLFAYASDEMRVLEFVDRFAKQLAREPDSWSGVLFRRHPAAVSERVICALIDASRKPPRHLLEALGAIRSEEAATRLGLALGDPKTVPSATKYFERNPELGLAHLPALAKRRGKKWAPARTLLAKLDRGARRSSVELAAESSWPPFLREAPWRAPMTPIAELELTPIDVEELIREPYATPLPFTPGREEWAEEAYAKAGPRRASMWHLKHLPSDRVREILSREGHEMRLYPEDLGQVMARFGDEFASVGVTIALKWPGRHLAFLTSVRSVRAVHALMCRLAEAPELRRAILPAFEREAATVALALIPVAFAPIPSRPNKAETLRRYHAERMLGVLQRQGYELELRRMATRYGVDASRAMETLFERASRLHPPLDGQEAPTSKALPPLMLRSGGALGPEAVRRVLEMLRFAARDPYLGLLELREALTPESADAFAGVLFREWELSGMSGAWPLFAVGHLGGEDCAREMESRLRAWPTNGPGVQRMKDALEALALNASDLALLQIRAAGQRSHYEDTKALVHTLLHEVAKRRGTTLAQLRDRLVPTLGVETGWPRLDYGSRRFEVRVDECLQTYVVGDDGSRRDKPPRARKADDPVRVRAAKARFAAFRDNMENIVRGQLSHFQRALREQRTWTPGEFAFIAGHPLLSIMARGLAWASGAEVLRFDVDGRFTTASDEPFLPEAPIRLAHPAVDDLARIGELFLDYELLPLFPQVDRSVYRPTSEEREATVLDRFAGQTHGSRALLRLLEDTGWRRVKAGLHVTHLGMHVGAGLVQLALSPSLPKDRVSPGKHSIGDLALRDHSGVPLAFEAVDAVRLSELFRDLSELE